MDWVSFCHIPNIPGSVFVGGFGLDLVQSFATCSKMFVFSDYLCYNF